MPSKDTNYEIAERLGRVGAARTEPKHLRLMGGYCVFAAAVLLGVNAHAWSSGEIWPKALVIAPAVLLLGTWLLVDAVALANGARRHQKAILWACIGVGSLAGFGVLYALTGRLF